MREILLDSITQDDLREIAASIPDSSTDLTPIQAAARSFVDHGLDQAMTNAQREVDAFHSQVLEILDAVWENDAPQPNDCAECSRSFGPNYAGSCEH